MIIASQNASSVDFSDSMWRVRVRILQNVSNSMIAFCHF